MLVFPPREGAPPLTSTQVDNFSAGTRGATSAEYFLSAGYATIFLHRQFSLLPFSRHYTHATDCFLDFLSEVESPSGAHVVTANEAQADRMLDVLRRYKTARKEGRLLLLPFVTITDYLYELRAISKAMRPLGPSGLLYLAAAVSDFYIPPDRMAEHKIQSTDLAGPASQAAPGPIVDAPAAEYEEEEEFDNFDASPPRPPRAKRLVVDLDPVPKFLKNLKDGWCPDGFVVSFKLETDPAILVLKARRALERYQHHLVIGNLLSTRKWEVVFVAPDQPDGWVRVPSGRRKKSISGVEGLVGAADKAWDATQPVDPQTMALGDPEVEIEGLIISALKDLHTKHIDARQVGRGEEATLT